MELLFAAKYPFTSQAKQALAESGLAIGEDTLSKGYERAKAALSSGKIPKTVEIESALLGEIASYAAARLLLLSLNNRYLTNRYAVAEAKRASSYLSGESEGSLELLCRELGLPFEKKGNSHFLPFQRYLRFNPHSAEYRLPNRKIALGSVQVSPHERIRIMEEAIRMRIEQLPDAKPPPAAVALAKKLLAHLPREELNAVKLDSSNYPPCIQNMLMRLKMSENIPHTARWTLATYMLKTGMKSADVMALYRSAPDYSERTTRYQVEYLKQKGYSMPSCITMDSYGLCVARCRCANPLNFRKDRHGKFAEETRADLQQPGAPAPGNALSKEKWERAKNSSK